MEQLKLLAMIERNAFQIAVENIFKRRTEFQASGVNELFRTMYAEDNIELLFLLEENQRKEVVGRLNALNLIFKAHSFTREDWVLQKTRNGEFDSGEEAYKHWQEAAEYLGEQSTKIELLVACLKSKAGIENEKMVFYDAEWNFVRTAYQGRSEAADLPRDSVSIGRGVNRSGCGMSL